VSVVRDLGVLLNQELSMKKHISKVNSNCFFQVRGLNQFRLILGLKIIANIIAAVVTSRLDHCNAVLARLPKSIIVPLQAI